MGYLVLANKRVAVLCSEEDKDILQKRFKSIENLDFVPAIEHVDDMEAVKEAYRLIDSADYIVFGSKHAVRLMLGAIGTDKVRKSLSNGKLVFAVGGSTKAELEKDGIKVEFAPETGGIAEVCSEISGMGRGLILEISGSSDKRQGVAPKGFLYAKIKVYSVKPCLKKFRISDYGALVLQSSMELKALEKALGYRVAEMKDIIAVVIGAKTFELAKHLFSRVELCESNDIAKAIDMAIGGTHG